jgi:hypothetical protein
MKNTKIEQKNNLPKDKQAIKKQALIFALKIFIIVLIIGSIIGGFWGVSKAYEGKIYPKVTIATIKVGGKTPEEATKIINDYLASIEANGPKLVYESKDFQPKLSELGISFDVKSLIEEAYNYGRMGRISSRLQETGKLIVSNYNIPLSPKTDEKKLDAYLSQIATVVEVAPVNAGLEIKNGIVYETQSQKGLGLNKNQLKTGLMNVINNQLVNGIIDLKTTELEPSILAEGTVTAKNEAEKLMAAAPIYISYEDKNFTANKEEIGSWIEFKEDGSKLNAILANDKIAGFTNYIASKIQIKKIDREVQDGTGDVLNEGQDGLGVNVLALTNDLKARALAGTANSQINVTTFPIPKEEVIIYPSAQPGRYAGRYIDINLAEQKLYAFDGTSLANSFYISSGRSGYETPTGEYSVWTQVRSQVMDGPDFYLPNVQWVSYFNGEISIHGAYWHNNFGQPMSHGCINMRNGDAEWVYNYVQVGTPIYVHY